MTATGSFAKVYQKLWDGTLGPPTPPSGWQVLTVLLAHCNAQGIVDMTPSAIANRSGMTLEAVQEGLRILEAPDPESRTPDNEGRRIVLIDEHRTWGWRIVNHEVYRSSSDAQRQADFRARHLETVREAERQRSRARRAEATVTRPSRPLTVPHQAEAEAEAERKNQEEGGERSQTMLEGFQEAEKVASRVEACSAAVEFSRIRLKDGSDHVVTVADRERYLRTFPKVDVDQALRTMEAWALANPALRKTRRGVERFVTGWLAGDANDAARGAPARGFNPRRQADESYVDRNLAGGGGE